MIIGFVAGALAVLVFHQMTIVVLGLLGVIPAGGYSFKPGGPLSVPALINSMFWGGLWGAAYPFIKHRLPGPYWLGGIIFGIVGTTILGGWIVVALLKGNPMFAGFNPLRMIVGPIIGGMFGLGLALFYDLLSKKLSRS